MAEQVLTFQNHRLNHELNMLKIYCKCDTSKSTWDDAVARHHIDGEIVCVDTNPGGTAPSDDYDPGIKNSLGIDIMGGELDDRDEALAERAYPSHVVGQTTYIVPAPVEGCLTVEMSGNAVNGADWYMYVYYRKKETARG
jgi:hypothetical protein